MLYASDLPQACKSCKSVTPCFAFHSVAEYFTVIVPTFVAQSCNAAHCEGRILNILYLHLFCLLVCGILNY